MSVKIKKTKSEAPSPRDQQIINATTSGVRELFAQHIASVESILEESEDKRVTVTFKVDLDASESAPTLEVGIRYSQAVTDKRIARLDDPNQDAFSFMKASDFREAQLKLKDAAGEPKDEE